MNSALKGALSLTSTLPQSKRDEILINSKSQGVLPSNDRIKSRLNHRTLNNFHSLHGSPNTSLEPLKTSQSRGWSPKADNTVKEYFLPLNNLGSTNRLKLHENSQASILRTSIDSKHFRVPQLNQTFQNNSRPQSHSKPIDAIKIIENGKAPNLNEKKKNLSPRTLGTHYNYHNQHLTFIPQNINKSAMNSTFSGFNELAKKVKSAHQSMLESLVMDESSLQTVETNGEDAEKRLGKIRKVLKFNKLQKESYDTEIYRQEQDIMLPLFKNEKEKLNKEKKMGIVKVLPSKNTYYQAVWEAKMQKNGVFDLINSSSQNTSHEDIQAYQEKVEKLEKIKFDDFEAKASHANFKYKFFWYYADETTKLWAPDSREGHSLTTIGKYLVLYGGMNSNCKNDITLFLPGKNQWKKIPTKGDIPTRGRYGHTACAYKGSIIIFGGEGSFRSELKYRECLGDVRTFTLETGEWRYYPCVGRSIQARRNHAAAIHEQIMYVYGGINTEGNYLEDVWTLNLRNFTWNHFEVFGESQGAIASHRMCACYLEKSNSASPKFKLKQKTITEGIYVFGGKDESGQVLGTLKILDTNGKPMWKYPTTKGSPPSERYNHSTLFYERLSLLIIHGGKNDSFHEFDTRELNDLHVLNLETLTWHPIVSHGDSPNIPRMNHSATLYGTTMIIFGGIGPREFHTAQARFVELSQTNVQKLIEEYNQNQNAGGFVKPIGLGSVVFDDDPTSPVGRLIKDAAKRPVIRPFKVPTFSPLQRKSTVSFLPNPKIALPEEDKLQGKKELQVMKIIAGWKRLTNKTKGTNY